MVLPQNINPFLLLLYFQNFIYLFIIMDVGAQVSEKAWLSEENFQESVVSFCLGWEDLNSGCQVLSRPSCVSS